MSKVSTHYFLLAAVATLVITEDVKVEESQSRGVHKLPVKYRGPVVYSGLPPPVVHFPSFPKNPKSISYRNGEEGDGPSRPVEYVPLPYHDLPVLIYQSQHDPPIHVVNQTDTYSKNYNGRNTGSSSTKNRDGYTNGDTISYGVEIKEDRRYGQNASALDVSKSSIDVSGPVVHANGKVAFKNGSKQDHGSYDGVENSYSGSYDKGIRGIDTNRSIDKEINGYSKGLGQIFIDRENDIKSYLGQGVNGNDYREIMNDGYRRVNQIESKQATVGSGRSNEDGYRQENQSDYNKRIINYELNNNEDYRQIHQSDYTKASTSYERGREYNAPGSNTALSDIFKIFATQPIFMEAPNEPQPIYVLPHPVDYSKHEVNLDYRISTGSKEPLGRERERGYIIPSIGGLAFRNVQGQRRFRFHSKDLNFPNCKQVAVSSLPIQIFPSQTIVHKAETSKGGPLASLNGNNNFVVLEKCKESISAPYTAFGKHGNLEVHKPSTSILLQKETTTNYKAPEEYILRKYQSYQLSPTGFQNNKDYTSSASTPETSVFRFIKNGHILNVAGNAYTDNIQNYPSVSQRYFLLERFGDTNRYIDHFATDIGANVKNEYYDNSPTGYEQASIISEPESKYGNRNQEEYGLLTNYKPNSGSYQATLNRLGGALPQGKNFGLHDMLNLRFRNILRIKRLPMSKDFSEYNSRGSEYGRSSIHNAQYLKMGGYSNRNLKENRHDPINGVKYYNDIDQKKVSYQVDNFPNGTQQVQDFGEKLKVNKEKYNNQEYPYPKINYRDPPTFARAAPFHNRPPIIIYQGLRPPVHVYSSTKSETPTEKQRPLLPAYKRTKVVRSEEFPTYGDQASTTSNYYQSSSDVMEANLQSYEIGTSSLKAYNHQPAQDEKSTYPKKSLNRGPWIPVHLLDEYV